MAEPGLYGSDSEVSSIAYEDDSDQESLLPPESTETGRGASDDQQQATSDVNSTATQASKAIEAAEEGSPGPSNAPQHPSSSSLEARSNGPEWFDEQTPLLDAGPAPPDYAAATAWRTTDTTQEYTANDTVSNHVSRALKECLALLAPWSHLTRNKRWRKILRSFSICVCLTQLVVVCIVISIVVVVRQKVQYARPNESHPRYNLLRPEIYHSRFGCQFESYSDLESSYIETSGIPDRGDFIFWESMTAGGPSDPRDVRITGTVEIRPAPYWQKERMEIWFNAATTKPWLAQMPEFTLDQSGLEIHTPRMRRHSSTEVKTKARGSTKTTAPAECYDLWVGVYILGGLENFEVHTANLDVDVRSDGANKPGAIRWTLDVQNQTNISATGGSVLTEKLNSRVMRVETKDWPITGEYGFSDKMDLTTRSGAIVGYALPFGNSTVLARSNAGEPALHREGRMVRELHTSTESGETTLTIYNPPPYDSHNALVSHHYSDSGRIDVYSGGKDYWQGNIDILTSNGTIRLEGEDVERLLNYESGPPLPLSRVRAKQGNHDSDMSVETVSGNITVLMTGF